FLSILLRLAEARSFFTVSTEPFQRPVKSCQENSFQACSSTVQEWQSGLKRELPEQPARMKIAAMRLYLPCIKAPCLTLRQEREKNKAGRQCLPAQFFIIRTYLPGLSGQTIMFSFISAHCFS